MKAKNFYTCNYDADDSMEVVVHSDGGFSVEVETRYKVILLGFDNEQRLRLIDQLTAATIMPPEETKK